MLNFRIINGDQITLDFAVEHLATAVKAITATYGPPSVTETSVSSDYRFGGETFPLFVERNWASFIAMSEGGNRVLGHLASTMGLTVSGA